jgi:hypothetical protein
LRVSTKPRKALLVTANSDMAHPHLLEIGVETRKRSLANLLRNTTVKVSDGIVRLELGPGEVFVAEL